jgi:hypothetical protein
MAAIVPVRDAVGKSLRGPCRYTTYGLTSGGARRYLWGGLHELGCATVLFSR